MKQYSNKNDAVGLSFVFSNLTDEVYSLFFESFPLSPGDVEQDLDDVPGIQECRVEEELNLAGKEEVGEAAQNDTEDSGEEASPSSESGQIKTGETSPQDSHISDMSKSHEVDKNIEKPSGISQEECDEGKQTQEAESNLTPQQTDDDDADDEPLVRTSSSCLS